MGHPNGTALREQVMRNSSALSEILANKDRVTRVLKAIQDTLHTDKARADGLQHILEKLLEDVRHPQDLQDLALPKQNRKAITALATLVTEQHEQIAQATYEMVNLHAALQTRFNAHTHRLCLPGGDVHTLVHE